MQCRLLTGPRCACTGQSAAADRCSDYTGDAVSGGQASSAAGLPGLRHKAQLSVAMAAAAYVARRLPAAAVGRGSHPHDLLGFDKRAHPGELIVNVAVTKKIIRVFSVLYKARYPIRWMVLPDVYKGSDPRSTNADNTSAFNCGLVDGTKSIPARTSTSKLPTSTLPGARRTPTAHGMCVA